MPPLESLTKKLHVLLPELLELKFGCRMNRRSGGQYIVINDLSFGNDTKRVWVNSVPFGLMPLELEKDLIESGGEWEILGAPITLEDVLKALNQVSCEISIQGSGNFMRYDQHENDWTDLWTRSNRVFCWTLGLPLHEQSTELIQFLDSLIPEQKTL